jgi:acetolactate synthase-1/2/3 large subunit
MSTGAEALIRTAVQAGVEVCFANPGTSELSLVEALDSVPGVRAVLGLFEGVCTGAADGYARMAGKPALTLTHLGPGFGNGIANVHNARRARVPLVNLIGDHATWHLDADSPLTSDIESLAAPVSDWVRRARSAEHLGADMAAAVAAAKSAGGRVATLIVPSDCAWGEAADVASPCEPEPPASVDSRRIEAVAEVLGGGKPCALLLGPGATHGPALAAAGRIADATGCSLWCDTSPTRIERGAGRPVVKKVPYFPEQAVPTLGNFAYLVLAGTCAPVAFFGYPGQPSSLVPESCTVRELASPHEDVTGALESLAEKLGAPGRSTIGAQLEIPERPTGELDPRTLGTAIAAVQPEGVIVMDEGVTSGLPWWLASPGCPPHDYLQNTGGAIGQGLPGATGAAIACPDRPVLALQADGSGAYTLQALWTQAREGLNVTTVLCANHAYRILQIELQRAGVVEPGPKASSFTDLSGPTIDWVSLARGFGVPGARAETADALVRELERALAEPGPYLIEAVI